MAAQRTYLAIDLKSFYASVECVDRHLDPLTTNLVVADASRTEKTMRYLEKQNIAPSIDNYEILYRGNLPTGKRSVPQPELLEQLYQKFNCAQPMDYHGHSLSVSDVILLNQAGKISTHYVDSIGFRELSGFQDKQERSSVLSQLKAKCDMPECNPTKCRKGRNDHAI